MRSLTILSTITLASSAAIITGCETTQTAGQSAGAAQNYAASVEAIETSTATLVVHGMGCPLCANNVDKQLLAVPGVERVNINLGDGQVKVHLAETNRPSKEQLARAVHQSGFTLRSIETP